MNVLSQFRSRKERSRFLKFSLVGGAGVVVNNGLLWLLVEFTALPFYFCSLVAIEASILGNFLLNDMWTWRDRRESRFWARLYRYNASTAFSSLFINVTVLLYLKEWLGVPYLLANLVGIGFSVIFNYLVNSVWTYGEFRFRYPRTVWLILYASLAVRFVLAAGLGPGFDEAYFFAYSLHPALSYFDQPAIVGFLAGYVPHLTGITNAFTIRLAAVLAFSITGLLLFKLARQFVSETTSIWAMFLFNATPIFFMLAGIFILPDVGLALFWILTLLIFYRILFKQARDWDWLLAGLTSGFAMLSKYHGLLLPLLLLLYLLFYDRKKLHSRGFYLYCGVVLLVFSPVLFWNAQHDWISFSALAAKAGGAAFSPRALGLMLAGQIGYLTPMIFIPMIFVGYRIWRGAVQQQPAARFYLFFGVLPVLLFLAGALFLPIKPHVTLVGYIVLTVPLAEMIAPAYRRRQWVSRLVVASLALLIVLPATLFLHTRYGILHLEKAAARGLISEQAARMDATLDMYGWEKIEDYVRAHDMSPDSLFLFTHRWFLSGQVSLATAGKYDVLCFDAQQPRSYGLWNRQADVLGKDGLCIYSNRYKVDAQRFAACFQHIEAVDSVAVKRGGVLAKTLYFVRMRKLERNFGDAAGASRRGLH